MQPVNIGGARILRVRLEEEDRIAWKIDDLSEACSRGESADQIKAMIDKVKADLILHGGNTNIHIASKTDVFGRTALHYAAMRSSASVVSLLLENHFSPNQYDMNGTHPLHLAIQCNNHEAAIVLCRVSDPRMTNNRHDTAIITLCQNTDQESNVKVLEELIKYGHDVNALDFHGRNALFSAGGKVKLMECLLNHGINVHQRDESQRTALFNAVYTTNLIAIKLLISAGSKVDIQDKMGLTPLMIACRFGGLPIVKLLLENGANVHATMMVDDRMMCPLSLAIQHGNYESARLLIESGARIDVQFDDTEVIWDLFCSVREQNDGSGNVEYKNEGSLYRKHWNLYHRHERLPLPQYTSLTSPCSRFDDFWVNIKVEFKQEEERSLFEYMLNTERERKMKALVQTQLVKNLCVPVDMLSMIASPLVWY